jgi:archaellum component FlaF (FlaF/FlaG flagellin family)
MRFLKRIRKSNNFWPLIILLLFGLLAAKGLIGSGYFNMHDDLQMMRQLEMEKCFMTLQIPCRWVPDMGYGFGFPLFNFYPPLPYLFGEIFRLLGTSFVDTVKLTFIFAFLASGVSMYFLAKEFWGKWGGVISAIFYIWAPYHSVDIYVRGAMNEAWGIIWFPSILASSYWLLTQKQNKVKNTIFLALSWVGLLLSHNLMALIFAPVFVGWCLIWFIREKNFSLKKAFPTIRAFSIAGVLAFCLAAFFTLPVTIEQKLVHTETLIAGYYDYSAHFATIRQLLFSRFWGYGPSVWGANDGLSFQVGAIHWILASIITGVIIVMILKRRQKVKFELAVPILFFFLVGWLAIFMIHNKSTPIWLHIQTLRYVQFPWRFLTLVMLSFSFIAGGIVNFIPKKYSYYVRGFLVVAVLIYSWNYFLPQHGKMGPLTDNQKFTGAAWDLQRTAGIYDYLPQTAVTAPKAPMTNFVEVLNGKADVTNIKLGTSTNTFDINVTKNAEVRLGVFAFPNWKVFVDGKEVKNFVPKSEEWGRMHVMIPAGQHSVYVHLYDTSVRTVGNALSLVSWVGLGGYLMLQFKRERRQFTLRS